MRGEVLGIYVRNNSQLESDYVLHSQLAMYTHMAVRNTGSEYQAAENIKNKLVNNDGLTNIRVTEVNLDGIRHIVVAVPAKYTNIGPNSGDIAIVPDLKTNKNNVKESGHVAIITEEDASNF